MKIFYWSRVKKTGWIPKHTKLIWREAVGKFGISPNTTFSAHKYMYTQHFHSNTKDILMKRVKLLRVFTIFSFHFVYFSSANIIQRGNTDTDAQVKTNIRKEPMKAKKKVVSNISLFLSFFFTQKNSRSKNIHSRFSGNFSPPFRVCSAADDDVRALWKRNRFFFCLLSKEPLFCHATTVNLTLINGDVFSGGRIKRKLFYVTAIRAGGDGFTVV